VDQFDGDGEVAGDGTEARANACGESDTHGTETFSTESEEMVRAVMERSVVAVYGLKLAFDLAELAFDEGS
jgi:hypothetical protein